MKIDAKLIEDLLKARGYGSNIAATVSLDLAADLERIGALKDRIWKIQLAIGEEEKRHVEAMSALRKQREDVRKDCPHWISTFHADPAGGPYSEKTCGICGHQL